MVSLKKHYTKKSLSRGHHLPLSSTPYQLSVTFSHTFLNRSAHYFFPYAPVSSYRTVVNLLNST
jgi:hypothetical protein